MRVRVYQAWDQRSAAGIEALRRTETRPQIGLAPDSDDPARVDGEGPLLEDRERAKIRPRERTRAAGGGQFRRTGHEEIDPLGRSLHAASLSSPTADADLDALQATRSVPDWAPCRTPCMRRARRRRERKTIIFMFERPTPSSRPAS